MLRRFVSALVAVALVASPAAAQRVGVGLGIGVGGAGGGGGTPALSSLAGSAAGDAPTGTVLAQPQSTLSGCTWSIASQSNFIQSASTGVVTKAAVSVSAGSYLPVTTCSLTANSQTVSVAASLALTISAPTSSLLFYGSDTSAPAQGAPENFGVGFQSGTTQAYLVLAKAGADETANARELATTAYPWVKLVPQSSGTYTLRAYDAATGGSMIGESGSFAVAASSLPSLPLAATAKTVLFGDSTMALSASFVNPVHASSAWTNRWFAQAMRKLGYPVDVGIWPNFHAGTGGSTEAGGGGGAIDAVVGDALQPVGTGSDGSSYPGFLTRLDRSLMQRPALTLIQVTVNGQLSQTPSAQYAQYRAAALRATLAGSRVLFVLMRPGDASAYANTAAQQQRADVNAAVVSLCTGGANAIAGVDCWDPSPVYTTTAGTASSYNDPTPLAASETTKTVGFHPTIRGGELEADSFIARATALGLFTSGASYPISTIVGGSGTDVTPTGTGGVTTALFNAGNNSGVTLSNASGTWANGLRQASGVASGVQLAGSIEAHAETGGRRQVITVTPAGSGTQQASVIFVRPTDWNASYRGLIGVAVQVEITDPDAIVSTAGLAMSGVAPSYQTAWYSADGDGGEADATGGVNPNTGTVRRWYMVVVDADGTQQYHDVGFTFTLLPAGKTQAATIKLLQWKVREIGTDRRALRLLPASPTLALNGSATSTSVPLRATLATSGVRPQGVRFWRRLTAQGSGWTFLGDVVAAPTATTVDYVATGLSSGTGYSFRAEAIRNGGVLGAGYGRWSAESVPTAVLPVTTP